MVSCSARNIEEIQKHIKRISEKAIEKFQGFQKVIVNNPEKSIFVGVIFLVIMLFCCRGKDKSVEVNNHSALSVNNPSVLNKDNSLNSKNPIILSENITLTNDSVASKNNDVMLSFPNGKFARAEMVQIYKVASRSDESKGDSAYYMIPGESKDIAKEPIVISKDNDIANVSK